MLLIEIIRVALEGIRSNKLRSLLTMLGIIFGVGAVITMNALGSGAQQAVQNRIEALGPTLLNVFSGQDFRGGVAVSGGGVYHGNTGYRPYYPGAAVATGVAIGAAAATAYPPPPYYPPPCGYYPYPACY
mgnify:CR=1 FL=1